MKKIIIILFVICISSSILPQISLRGGMGINFINTPSLRDYLNVTQATSADQLASFNTAINFFGEVDCRTAKDFELGLELAYLYNSFAFPSVTGRYELTYGVLMPSLLGYYVIDGPGYNFKFGGGLGPRFASINESILPFSNSYKSVGFGILLRALGNTALGSNVYANITGDLRYDRNGTPKNNGNPILNRAADSEVNLNSFSLGLSLGITYIF